MKKTFYIGLANSCHDPALAIVGPDGDVLFAEATERWLQNKRAWNCQPDTLFRIPELVRTYCDPAARFVVATTWTQKVYLLTRLYALTGRLRPESLVKKDRDAPSIFLSERYEYYWMMSLMLNSIREAGKNFAVEMRRHFGNHDISFVRLPHHTTHAAAACYASPFEEAACLVMDGFGEFGSVSLFRYGGGRIEPLKVHFGPGSLGFAYSRITQLCGFDWKKGEEWKTMGLAAYGKLNAEAAKVLRAMIKVRGTGIQPAPPARLAGLYKQLADLTREDLAFTGQHLFAEIMDQILDAFHRMGISDNLALSGGCALNSSYNGVLLERTRFRSLFVPPAPADDGSALGAALLAHQRENPGARIGGRARSPYLGSSLSGTSVENLLRFGGLQKVRLLPDTIECETARLLAQEKLVGWVQGRAEFGPRALGNRSILADPRPAGMKDKINSIVKFREEFRPFAPSILHEYGPEYFENYQESPYMERTLRFRPEVRSRVPAVVHVDGTGRLQTVKQEWNARFYSLIDSFRRETGVPLLLNTSLNVMGKPIVHSVEDAVSLFLTTGLDALVIGDYLIEK
jgi:carbamoyltransferase